MPSAVSQLIVVRMPEAGLPFGAPRFSNLNTRYTHWPGLTAGRARAAADARSARRQRVSSALRDGTFWIMVIVTRDRTVPTGTPSAVAASS